MSNLQTMPLMFKVWDKRENKYVKWIGETELDLWQLADLLDTYNVVEYEEDLVICQYTGLLDEENNRIYTGNIIMVGSEPVAVIYDKKSAQVLGQYSDGSYEDIARLAFVPIVGNIFENKLKDFVDGE